MSLRLLLDENISGVVAEQIRFHRPQVDVVSVHSWRGGAFLGQRDDTLLRAAREELRVLVTYDQNTVPPLFIEFVQNGEDHAGVLFVDRRTIASSDFGALVRALASFWDEQRDVDWLNAAGYLQRAAD